MLNKKILTLIFVVAFLFVGCLPTPTPPNEAPIITSSPVTTATVGVTYVYDVDATDPDGNTLTYSLTTCPSGMAISSATGLIMWNPTAEGNFAVVVKVSDGVLDISQSFTITVSTVEPGLIGIVVVPKTMALIVGESGTIVSVTAHYSDGSTVLIALGNCTYSSSVPGVATVIASEGYRVNAIAKGTTTITVDYAGKTDTIVVTVSEPPAVNQTPVASFTASPTSGTVPLEIYFDASNSYDPDGNIISYAWDFKDGNTGSGETLNHTFSSIGSYKVELTVTDDKGATSSATKTIIATEPIDNEIVYRALCVGVGDYIYGDDDDDLLGPPYDVDRMIQIFNQCQFGPLNTVFSTINHLKDWQATKSNILQEIASTFSGADNNDVSYFYYSGHGSRLENIPYLCPADVTSFVDSFISVDELESALSAILGTKVVFLDTCHSGGFIGKGKEKINISQEELESFNDEVINIFFQAEYKGLLITNQYKVLTSCFSFQYSAELIPVEGDPWGLFTAVLCEGCGYDSYTHPYPADENENGEITLHEAYTYTNEQVTIIATELNDIYGWDIDQDVQVYPNNSTYPIVEY